MRKIVIAVALLTASGAYAQQLPAQGQPSVQTIMQGVDAEIQATGTSLNHLYGAVGFLGKYAAELERKVGALTAERDQLKKELEESKKPKK